jgi:hypothetical protein
MKISSISKVSAAYASLAFLLSLLFLFVQVSYPACCDADQYVALGKLYAEKGIAANSSDAAVRTYFYPLVIGYLYKTSAYLMLPLNIVVFFIQFALYIFVVNKYVSVISIEFPIYRIVQGALLFNLFVYPFFSLTLTDSIYTSLVILWIYATKVEFECNWPPWASFVSHIRCATSGSLGRCYYGGHVHLVSF